MGLDKVKPFKRLNYYNKDKRNLGGNKLKSILIGVGVFILGYFVAAMFTSYAEDSIAGVIISLVFLSAVVATCTGLILDKINILIRQNYKKSI